MYVTNDHDFILMKEVRLFIFGKEVVFYSSSVSNLEHFD